MPFLFTDIYYDVLALGFRFAHCHDVYVSYIIDKKGYCINCGKFIAPYKKLELMVKLKEFTEGK